MAANKRVSKKSSSTAYYCGLYFALMITTTTTSRTSLAFVLQSTRQRHEMSSRRFACNSRIYSSVLSSCSIIKRQTRQELLGPSSSGIRFMIQQHHHDPVSLPRHQKTTTSSSRRRSPTTESLLRMSFVDDDESMLLDDDDSENNNDTIFALSSGSSPTGQATAVAVVRMSGPDSVPILQKLLGNSSNVVPKPRYAALRKLYRPDDTAASEPLDQALVLYFPGPHSYTGEDVVELQCHGSRAVLTAVLAALTSLGARLAEPGEFTQRAFAAGKLDVLQVEALADLLTADTDQQRRQALQQLDGQLSAVYTAWRQQLIAGLAHAEAVIDFGDDERLDDDFFASNNPNSEQALQAQQENIWGGVVTNMQELKASMQKQLSDQRRGELVREGVKIAIVGPPNAGKSSLFNLLAARDAAIVSPTAGTTRDVLEVSLNLGGVKCIVQDTAGVRSETHDVIEKEGMKRAVQAASQADFVVAMVDSSSDNVQVGLDILDRVIKIDDSADNKLDPNQILLVLNKADLKNDDPPCSDSANVTIPERIGGCFEVSCKTQHGIDSFLTDLTNRVCDRVGALGNDDGKVSDDYDVSQTAAAMTNEGALITRARHRQHIQAAVEALERFDMLSRQGSMAVDMAAEELRLAASELGRITGAVDVEDVLDKLFSDFCIGK